MNSNAVSFVWGMLRYSYAAVVFLAGLDKIVGTNLITDWPKYVSPFVSGLLPVDIHTFIIVLGVIEVAVAILALTRYTVLASYVSAAWLVLIAVNLLMIGGYVDVAIRDVLLAVGAVAAAQLGQALGHGIVGRTHA